MLELKTKWFNKWAVSNSVNDIALRNALNDLSQTLGVVNLGSGLFKVRVSKSGQGKRGGHRTIVVYKKSSLAIFVYGFAKNEKSNLNKTELKYFKKLARDLLGLEKQEFSKLIKLGNFIKIEV